MRRFKFEGDGPADVPALGLVDVQPGDIVEVDDTDIAAGMTGDGWRHVPNPDRSKAAKKAAATRTDEVKES